MYLQILSFLHTDMTQVVEIFPRVGRELAYSTQSNHGRWCPKISLPTRYSNHSCSLIDQIFCKVPNKENIVFSSSVIVNKLSDHFPCVVNMSILKETKKSPKHIYVRHMKESIIQDFRNDLMNSNIISKLNPNLMSDVNVEYKFEKKNHLKCLQ